MTFIDYYLVRLTHRPDYAKAEALAHATGDVDVEHYVDKLLEVLRDGVLDRDDRTERHKHKGYVVYVFQDHNGIGDGGSTAIGNSQWIARDYPDIFKALGVTIWWSRGFGVFFGQPDGVIW